MRKSNELQIGKAGEYLACADAIMKGLIAFPSEQGLPYDILIDTGKKLLRCQVKTTEKPRAVLQRKSVSKAYIFNIKRHGKNMTARYTKDEVDLFALVELETRTVGYITPHNLPVTMNLRVDRLRGEYYDEKGIKNHAVILRLKRIGATQTEASKETGLAIATVNRMWKDGYVPYKTNARYFSDLYRGREWFDAI